MLTNQILNRAMSAAVLGNWDVLNADDSSVKEVLKRTGERAFSVDLFHESVGGADFQKARQRALSGGQMMQRDMTTSNDANAVFQVPIGFIDYLFARTALLKAGARVKTGVGSLAYMRASAPRPDGPG
jgi:NADPH:quinone reductase-like Zn-dependent oxidoreductase